MDIPPYIPEIWKDLKLEYTDEYINKIKKNNKLKKINELNNINNKTPKIIKRPIKNLKEIEKYNNEIKDSKKYKGCFKKNSHCIIL